MEINHSVQGDVTVLAIKGRLDTLSASALDKKLNEIRQNNISKILIDLSELMFIASSGLRVLLALGKSVKANNGRLALAHMQQHVKDVFDVAGFTMLFSIYLSNEEALESY